MASECTNSPSGVNRVRVFELYGAFAEPEAETSQHQPAKKNAE